MSEIRENSCKNQGMSWKMLFLIWQTPCDIIINIKYIYEMRFGKVSNCLIIWLLGMLNVISEELQDCPLYYVIDKLANVIHCTVPSMLQFRSALLTLGYRVSSTHANSNGLKTDAPNNGRIYFICFLCFAL